MFCFYTTAYWARNNRLKQNKQQQQKQPLLLFIQSSILCIIKPQRAEILNLENKMKRRLLTFKIISNFWVIIIYYLSKWSPSYEISLFIFYSDSYWEILFYLSAGFQLEIKMEYIFRRKFPLSNNSYSRIIRQPLASNMWLLLMYVIDYIENPAKLLTSDDIQYYFWIL